MNNHGAASVGNRFLGKMHFQKEFDQVDGTRSLRSLGAISKNSRAESRSYNTAGACRYSTHVRSKTSFYSYQLIEYEVCDGMQNKNWSVMLRVRVDEMKLLLKLFN